PRGAPGVRAAGAAAGPPGDGAVHDRVHRHAARGVGPVGDQVDAVRAVGPGAAVRPVGDVVVVDLRVALDRVPAGAAERGRGADLDAGDRRCGRGGAEAGGAVAAGVDRGGAVAEGGRPDVRLLAVGVEGVVVELRFAVGVRGDVHAEGVGQQIGELRGEVEAEVDVP